MRCIDRTLIAAHDTVHLEREGHLRHTANDRAEKVSWRDADNCEHRPTQAKGLAYYLGIARKSPLPKGVADHRNRRAFLFTVKGPSHNGGDTESRVVIGR